MSEPCPECNNGNTFIEYESEQNTGRSGFCLRTLHCPNCGTRTSKLVPC